jgi:hypothetical protein
MLKDVIEKNTLFLKKISKQSKEWGLNLIEKNEGGWNHKNKFIFNIILNKTN